MKRGATWWPLTWAVALAACATGGVATDTGRPMVGDGGGRDAGSADASRVDAGAPADASEDAALSPTDAAGVDAAAPVDASSAMLCAPTAATLHIVEVMQRTGAGTDDRGEWFEVVNSGSCTIDLAGVLIVSPDTSGTERSVSIPSGAIPAGGRFVFARSSNAIENHGLPTVGFAYGVGANLLLDNAGDWIELRSGAGVLDRVEWSSTDVFTAGARSWRFPDDRDPSTNGTRAFWCFARDAQVYSTATGGPFYGTPGAANATCP